MRRLSSLPAVFVLIGICVSGATALRAQNQNYAPPPDLEAIHVPYDLLLDTYVRDGLVYYRALQQDRGKLNRYLAVLAGTQAADVAAWSKAQQIAFWINAYNAFVLNTVVTHYPIRGTSKQYPANSIRQIPGAFETTKHTAAGRTLTLDQIETTILGGYNDPRIYVALGRGAVGSGRLRSEAFSGSRLEQQLAQSTQQFATSPQYVRIDQLAGKTFVSPILSWRGPSFIAAYADKSFELPKRTPIELAAVGLLRPYFLPAEEEFLKKNSWQLDYLTFDWQLNDLTGGRP
ncbi:MAG: DUF547 domain-containing protein [Vicinamibacterales bacterium]|nr:DUF547 domain-containing protein [Vicinamibacterales bacterium]